MTSRQEREVFMSDEIEVLEGIWDFTKSIFSELSASGIIRSCPGIGKSIAPVFPWLRERIPAMCGGAIRWSVFQARRIWAVAHDPFVALFIVLMVASSVFGLRDVEIGQGLTMLGWMAWAICVAGANGKAVVRRFRARLNTYPA